MKSNGIATKTRKAARADLKALALRALEAGICVVPPAEDGSKRPLEAWKRFQVEMPTAEDVRRWYGPRTGIGFVCGAISGGLELFEFDDGETYQAFKARASEVGLADLVEALEAGYLEETPGGGIHWFYLADEARGNTKLAERPKPGKPTRDVLIETRGEGGYAIVAPSAGKVHPSGKPYKLLRGGIDSIVYLNADERETLWDLARSFNEMPRQAAAEPAPTNRNGTGQRPGDDFNARTTWDELLGRAGWTKVFTHSDEAYWRRPGKSIGTSATTNYMGNGLLYVFSTSTEFEPERTYTKFGAYARLEHAGDFAAAAKALAARGYGEPARTTTRASGGNGTNGATTKGRGRRPLTDLGNAERFVDRFGDRLRYCDPWGKWLVWDGRRWKLDDTARAQRLAAKAVRGIRAEAVEADVEEAKAIVRWAFTSERAERINAIPKLARALPGVPIVPDEMDRDPWLFNVRNGTIDLRTGGLRPHAPRDLITKLCPVAYDHEAQCPLWESTLALFFGGNAELIAYWRRICGYAMAGVIRDHVLPVAYGTGSNGKSTILGTLMDVFGPDYAMKAPPELLMAKSHEGHPTDRADLFGKRLVVAIETDANRRLNETAVKELTGGDRIRARRMREDFWEFNPTHTVIMATNHKPLVRGTDKGIWRRLKLVPFTVSVDGQAADLAMPQKLRAEVPGILAWCVRGCLEWQARGLDEPAEVRDATGGYRKEQDVLGAFLDEHTVSGPQYRSRAGKVYQRYKSWAEAAGEHVMSQRAFGTAVEERKIEKQTSDGVWYIGIGLRETECQQDGIPF